MSEYRKYDNANPYLWLLVFMFVMFWVMQWAGSRPVKLKPLSEKHHVSRSYSGR